MNLLRQALWVIEKELLVIGSFNCHWKFRQCRLTDNYNLSWEEMEPKKMSSVQSNSCSRIKPSKDKCLTWPSKQGKPSQEQEKWMAARRQIANQKGSTIRKEQPREMANSLHCFGDLRTYLTNNSSGGSHTWLAMDLECGIPIASRVSINPCAR